MLKIIDNPDNIVSAAHYTIRLRLVINDDDKVDKAALEEVSGAKGVFQVQESLQIIFGLDIVNKVYAEFESLIRSGSGDDKEAVKAAAAIKIPIWKRVTKTIGDIFIPIIPAIVASSLLMDVLNELLLAFSILSESGFFTLLNIFQVLLSHSYLFLIAISSARVFGGNIFLGAVIGMIMISPDLINAWDVANMDPSTIPIVDAWFSF